MVDGKVKIEHLDKRPPRKKYITPQAELEIIVKLTRVNYVYKWHLTYSYICSCTYEYIYIYIYIYIYCSTVQKSRVTLNVYKFLLIANL